MFFNKIVHFIRTFDYFMDRPGFEPGTNRLKAEYSTIELAILSLGHKNIILNLSNKNNNYV